ncbi:hypothetical protein FRC01_003195 [Tulasnella sp. 417]|nr:hypothetical protein FRC01_003195 [Tulasnella sp. 417]
MAANGSSTFTEAMERKKTMESELAPTTKNFGMVTFPYGSRSTPRQLPEDILIEIIHLAASNPRIDQFTGVLSDPTLLRSLTSYREVCKRWKAVIDGTSSLWGFLSIDDAPSFEALQKVIDKSGDAPLVISYGCRWLGLKRFVNVVAPQMHRCKALWIKIGQVDSDFLSPLIPLFAKPCPLLEELHFYPALGWIVQVGDIEEKSLTPSLNIWALRRNAGRLRVLSLGNALRWRTKSKLSNLRELKIDCPMVNFNVLIQALAESPLLRTLVVVASFQILYRDGLGQRGSTVELGYLTRMEIRNVDASFVQMMLSHINPPSLKELFISVSAFDSPLFPLGDVGPGYQALLISLAGAQGAVPIPIEVGMRVQELVVADNHTCCKLVVSVNEYYPSGFPIHFMQSLSNISRGWGSVSTPSLALLIGTTNPDQRDGKFAMTQEDLRPLMDLEGVTEIQVGKMVRSVQHLYERLSSAVGWEDQLPRWLLPQLAILVIEDQAEHDESLIKMLQDRYAAVVTNAAHTVAPSPFSLVKLVRRSEDVPRSEMVEAIRKAVGEEKFCIEIKPHV